MLSKLYNWTIVSFVTLVSHQVIHKGQFLVHLGTCVYWLLEAYKHNMLQVISFSKDNADDVQGAKDEIQTYLFQKLLERSVGDLLKSGLLWKI